VPTQPPAQESEPTAAPTLPPASPTPDPEPTAPAPEPTTLVEVDIAVLLEERCTACHSLDRVTAKSATAEEWEQIVARMVSKGAVLDDEEATLLIEYLTQTYGE